MNLSPAEIRDQVGNRDATVAPQRVRLTHPGEFVDELKKDAALISDRILRVGTDDSRATVQDVSERFVPGGDRPCLGWLRKNVTASYLCRGQLVQLSTYCGVARIEGSAVRDDKGLTEATALKVRDALQTVLGAAEKLDLDVRGGGVYLETTEWKAQPDEEIRAAPQDTCASCGEPIYHANDQWRHKKSKRAEAFIQTNKPGPLPGSKAKILDHLADPQEKGKKY